MNRDRDQVVAQPEDSGHYTFMVNVAILTMDQVQRFFELLDIRLPGGLASH